ncbi:MAG: hypothetical protein ABJN14_09530 [Paracoccaceae bacterium]
MSHRRSSTLKTLIAINCALLLCAVTAVSVASLVGLNPFSQTSQVGGVHIGQVSPDAQTALDQKYARLLKAAKDEIEAQEEALQNIRQELNVGYVVSKDINISDSNRAYWLSEPKLMLGVNSLSGGSLKINFADQRTMIAVGERIDFKMEDCDCFLLLKSSQFGNANFRFACTPSADSSVQAARNTVIDARLN